jgi:hypothetical protein
MLVMILRGLNSLAGAQEVPQRIATNGLNEFDLADYCYGAQYRADPGSVSGVEQRIQIPHSRFGYDGMSTSQNAATPHFAYITARYYVQIGPYGDPAECAFKRYLYRLNQQGSFLKEEIDEQRFEQIDSRLRAFARTYQKSNAGKDLGQPNASRADSVGGCLFPMEWGTNAGKDYSLLSVARYGGISNYVIPHYERTLNGEQSNCHAWGERHITNSSITSSSIAIFSLDPSLRFVEDKTYQMGFLFKASPDIQCVKGADSFSRHILVERSVFDTQIRPELQSALRRGSVAAGPADSDGKSRALSFLDSVRLSQEFAALVVGLTEKRGCY